MNAIKERVDIEYELYDAADDGLLANAFGDNAAQEIRVYAEEFSKYHAIYIEKVVTVTTATRVKLEDL